MTEVVCDTQSIVASGLPRCRVVAVIPAYNEARLIGSVVLMARRYAQDVIVVDDGSTDETAAVARAARARVVAHAENRGKGAALNTGLQAAQSLDPEAVVLLDGDGQHRPGEIPLLAMAVLRCWQCADGCGWRQRQLENGRLASWQNGSLDWYDPDDRPDIVVGSRYLDGRSAVPRHRIWGHRAFNLLTQGITGVKSTDSQSGYRAFSKRALGLMRFNSNGFSVESEMQFLAHEHGLRLVDVSVEIAYHEAPKRNVVRHGLIVLNGMLRLMGQYRPLLYFGVPGAMLFVVGFGLGYWVVGIFLRVRQIPVGTAFASMLFTITGLIMLSTGVVLHSIRGLLNEILPKYLQEKNIE